MTSHAPLYRAIFPVVDQTVPVDDLLDEAVRATVRMARLAGHTTSPDLARPRLADGLRMPGSRGHALVVVVDAQVTASRHAQPTAVPATGNALPAATAPLPANVVDERVPAHRPTPRKHDPITTAIRAGRNTRAKQLMAYAASPAARHDPLLAAV